MDNLIGILATIVLVGTVCTLIFAIAAYVLARRRTHDYIKVAQMVPDPIQPEDSRSQEVVQDVIFRQTGTTPTKATRPEVDLEREQAIPPNRFDFSSRPTPHSNPPSAGEVFRWK